jgi:hypothetical protein
MDVRSWMWMAAGGIGLAALGWIIFIPADPYYTPSIYGFTNRVNAVAGLGCVLLVYAALGIVGEGVRRVTGTPPLIAAAITVGLGVFLGATYVRVLERHERIWNAAGRLETAGMAQIKARLAHLPDDTTLLVGGYPANESLGVPIFSTDWDLNGLAELTYRNGRIRAYPILPGLRVSCGATGISLTGPGAPDTATRYGRAWLVDLSSSRQVRPASRRECIANVSRYGPGPLYLTTVY